MNTNFIVFGLTRPGIEPRSTILVAGALFTRPEIGSLVCFGEQSPARFDLAEIFRVHIFNSYGSRQTFVDTKTIKQRCSLRVEFRPRFRSRRAYSIVFEVL